jgi:hypothetical protein
MLRVERPPKVGPAVRQFLESDVGVKVGQGRLRQALPSECVELASLGQTIDLPET